MKKTLNNLERCEGPSGLVILQQISFRLSCSECIWCSQALLGVGKRNSCSLDSLFLVSQYIFLSDMWLRLA